MVADVTGTKNERLAQERSTGILSAQNFVVAAFRHLLSVRAGSLQVTRPAFALQLEEAKRGCALARVFSKEICNEATTFHNSTRSWVFGVDTVALIADCVVGAGIQSTGCQRAHTEEVELLVYTYMWLAPLSVDNPLVGAAGALAVELVAQPVRVPQDHTLLPALLYHLNWFICSFCSSLLPLHILKLN